MGSQAKSVLEAALKLPESDRAVLAERLLATLPPDVDEMTDDELAAELERRSEECRRDPTSVVPWSELKHKR